MVLGFLVGAGRETYGVPAPAISGHPDWERLNRAHQNSLEQLVLFMPLFLAYCFNAGMQTGIVARHPLPASPASCTPSATCGTPSAARPARSSRSPCRSGSAVGAVIGLVVKIARS